MEKRYSFKRLFWSYTFCGIPFLILAAFLSLFNVIPVDINNAHYYGITGFLITFLFIPFVGLILGCTNWLALNFGSLLYDFSIKILKGK
jgi:hypothetical protein